MNNEKKSKRKYLFSTVQFKTTNVTSKTCKIVNLMYIYIYSKYVNLIRSDLP